MNLLLSLTEQMVSAFQYFLDTLLGGLMFFTFSQVPVTKKNVVSMTLLSFITYLCVLVIIVTKNQANIGILYTLCVHLPFILWFLFVFKVPVSIVFISHFLTYAILSSRLFFGNLSLQLLQAYIPEINSAIATRIGWILSGPLVVFSALYFLAHRFPDLVSQNRSERWLLLTTLGGIYILIQLVHLNGLGEKKIDTLIVSLIFSIFLFSFIISVCMYSAKAKEADEIKERNTAYSIQTEGLALLTATMSDYLQNTARLRHDHRHFLTLIGLYSQTGNLQEISNLVKETLEVFDTAPPRVTGDDILDGIISLFRKRADTHRVHIILTGNSLLELPISRDDLCLMLCNCLENAIEGAKSSSVAIRQVTISVARKKDTGTIALLVQNPCSKTVEFSKNGIPLSHKGESHGFGTRSIKLIVDKHKGLCNFSVEQDMFSFRAVFFA